MKCRYILHIIPVLVFQINYQPGQKLYHRKKGSRILPGAFFSFRSVLSKENVSVLSKILDIVADEDAVDIVFFNI